MQNYRNGSITNIPAPLSCEHPKLVFNQYLGRFIQVPCRTCNTCKLRHSNEWVHRLDTERRKFPYCFFVTLTYDAEHLPRASATEIGNYFHFQSDLCDVDFTISKNDLTPSEIDYWRKNSDFGYLDKQDVILFHKRLRQSVNQINKNEKVLYYTVGEYGPTTLRPHFHCLYFLRTREAARCFPKVIRQTWRNGNITASIVSGNASSYVARYANCFSHIPKALMFKGFSPFQVVSKSHIFGTSSYDDVSLQKIIGQSLTKISVPDFGKPTFHDVRLFRFLENHLFPKPKGYDSLDFAGRRRLYTLSCAYPTYKDLSRAVNDPRTPTQLRDSILVKRLGYTENTLKSLLTISNKFLKNCIRFSYDKDTYLELIDIYYNKKEKEKLKDFYNQINIYLKCLPNANPIYFYYWDNSVDVDYICTSFGLDCIPLYITAPLYDDMVSHSAAMVKKSTKTKYKNDYLIEHPELIDKLFV